MATATNRLLKRTEHLFLVPYMLMLSTALYFVFSTSLDVGELTRANDSGLYLGLWIGLYVLLLLFYFLDLPSLPRGLWLPVCLTISTVITYLSFGVETSSINKYVTLLATLLFGCWAASRIETTVFFRYYFNVATAVAAVHLALFPIFFSLSLHFDPLQRVNIFGTTAYAGLFAHKNNAGTFFALAILVGIARARSPRGRFTPAIVLGLVLQFIGLGLSGAVGPLIAMAIALLVMLVLTTYSRNPVGGAALALATATAFVLFVVFQNVVLNSLSRDATLTGRAYLYAVFWQYFQASPLVGYGYGEAFNGLPNSVGALVNAGTGKSYAHYINFESGILQCLIDFGLLGFILYAMMVWRAGRYSWRLMRSTQPERFVPLAVFVYIVTSSLNEVFIVLANTPPLAFLTFLFAKDTPLIARRIARRRRQIDTAPLPSNR